MPFPDLLQALAVVVIWGVNFVAIKWGVSDVPPLLLGALRFALAAFPAMLLIPRPALPLRWLVMYGGTMGAIQFALLFTAMKVGMPAGLASVVMQAQAFFTLMVAVVWLKEHWQPAQLLGLACAAGGLVLIALSKGGSMTAVGLLLTLGAAFSWALSNVVIRASVQAGHRADPLSVVVWASLVPPLPLLAMSYWLEGPAAISAALSAFSGRALGSLLYLSFVSTLIGYGLWSRLLTRHPANKVAPFSLLVPVAGLLAAQWILGEHLTSGQAFGSLLLMAGLLINVFGAPVLARLGWQGFRG